MNFNDYLLLIDHWVWGYPLQILLFGVSILLVVQTRAIGIRGIPAAFKLLFTEHRDNNGGVSPVKILTTALSSTVGVGNIIGVSTAVFSGGPGAIFWLWIMGFFSMHTKYAEGYLAVRYRFRDEDGKPWGGPMSYIIKGLGENWRWLAVVFASCTLLAGFGIGNTVQSHSAAEALERVFGIDPIWIGVVMAALVGVVIVGGIKRIGSFTIRLVPFMGLFYVVCCLLVITHHVHQIVPAIKLIVHDAFAWQAAGGALFGFINARALSHGIARGIFSNEAGLGSAPMAHAASQVEDPKLQGMVAMMGTFFDTIVICAATGLVLVISGAHTHHVEGFPMAAIAFTSALPSWGMVLLSLSVAVFAFSTMLGWSYYMETAVRFLFGKRYIRYMQWIWIAMIVVGSVISTGTLWHLSDILNALMAVPNLVAILFLFRQINP